MFNWIDHVYNIKNGSKNETCGICGGKIEYREVLVSKDGCGYADVWCDRCKAAHHISRGYFETPIETTFDTPKDLRYL